MMLPSDVRLSNADRTDAKRRDTPEGDSGRVLDIQGFSDCSCQVSHTGSLHSIGLDNVNISPDAPDLLSEHFLFRL